MAMFKPPIGTPPERDKCVIWPKGWRNSNRYGGGPSGKVYRLDDGTSMGFHTGVDLVRNDKEPTLRQPVFAIGPGRVMFAEDVPVSKSRTWGKVVVIYHGEIEKGVPLFSRYAHLASIGSINSKILQKGDRVTSDTRIGLIGSGPASSGMAPHLHFDISVNNALQVNELDWPGNAKALVDLNYKDPEVWFTENHILTKDADGRPVSAGQPADAKVSQPAAAAGASVGENVQPMTAASNVSWFVTARNGTQIRKELGVAKEATLPYSFEFPLQINPEPCRQEDSFWVQITSGMFNGHWVKYSNQNQTEIYISTTRPPR